MVSRESHPYMGLVREQPPPFFEGNSRAFTGLYFNLEDEKFEFFRKRKMRDDPLWIDVTSLLKDGMGRLISRLYELDLPSESYSSYMERLNRVYQVTQKDFHIDEIVGRELEEVVNIFNIVNSGGTKLSKGDLAMAKISATWPDARERMNEKLKEWERNGFKFRLEWYLRCINATTLGKSKFIALAEIDKNVFQIGLKETTKSIDTSINLISSRLGLDHDQVFKSKYSIALISRYMKLRGKSLTDAKEIGKLLFWYVHTLLWGHYSSSPISVLRQDLSSIENNDDPIGTLIDKLRQNRGSLEITSADFKGWSKGARFYPILYMLTRMNHALDWHTETELSQNLLGSHAKLQIHHIFPKTLLYKSLYLKKEVNALANFTFLTAQTNQQISAKQPEEYLSVIQEMHPGVLESHWIPTDRNLWKIENYRLFLEERRNLLAKAANEYVDSLLMNTRIDIPAEFIAGGIETEEEEMKILSLCDWLCRQGLSAGEEKFSIINKETGKIKAILDMAWPKGIQEGLTEPIALLLEEPQEVLAVAGQAGFRFFTSISEFKDYVLSEVLEESNSTSYDDPLRY